MYQEEIDNAADSEAAWEGSSEGKILLRINRRVSALVDNFWRISTVFTLNTARLFIHIAHINSEAIT